MNTKSLLKKIFVTSSIAIAAVFISPLAKQAKADDSKLATYNSQSYNIEVLYGAYEDYESIFTNQPWWGDPDFAGELAEQIGSSLGGISPTNTTYNALYIYGDNGTGVQLVDSHESGHHHDHDGQYFSEYRDNPYNFQVVAFQTWGQSYAAMQHVGLDAINNQTSLVLNNAGECKNNGWTIDDGKYCVFVAASNATTDVYSGSTYGGYETANFTSSYGFEVNHNDKWTFGLAYGNGTSNFGAFNFSTTTASIESDNNFYSAYAVKKANKDLKLSWLMGASDHDYDGSRTFSGNTATSSYTSNGFAAAMDAVWDKNVIGKKGRPYTFQPKLGLAYASHDQDGFSETGSGALMTISKSEIESFLVKGGIDVSTQLIVNQGKNLFVPRLGLGYEMDMRSDWDTSDSIKAKLTSSTSDPTAVKAKTIGKNKGFLNVGADYYLTDRLLVNANARLKVTGEGSESSYGGGFNWFF